jgi:hypothetical protein
MTVLIFAALGVKAFYLLYIWLASAWIAGELSRRKGYGEKWGLGSGLLLSFIGVIVWLLVPAKADSIWKERGWRRAKAERVDNGTTTKRA